jgi:hypothetical protein
MKATAVESLFKKMLYIENEYDMKLITKSQYQDKRRDIIDQANEMFEQQIGDAWRDGFFEKSDTSKVYYHKTFKIE